MLQSRRTGVDVITFDLAICWEHAELGKDFRDGLEKDREELKLMSKKEADDAAGATSTDVDWKQAKEEMEDLSVKLRRATLAFGAHWLLHHCRPKVQPAGKSSPFYTRPTPTI